MLKITSYLPVLPYWADIRRYPIFRLTSWHCNPTDASRRHKTPESETNDVITQSESSGEVSGSLSSRSHNVMSRELVDTCIPNGLCYERLLLSRNGTGLLGLWRGTPSGAQGLGSILGSGERHTIFKAVLQKQCLCLQDGQKSEVHGESSPNNYPKPIK